MITLGINTASPTTEIALINGDKTIMAKSWQSNYDEAEKLLPEIINSLPPNSSLDQIFVVSGPGSYTGLRIGVTSANVVGMLKKAPIKTLNTFDFLHSRLPNNEKTAVVLRAGGQNIAVTSEIGEDSQQMPMADLQNYIKQNRLTHIFTVREEVNEHIERENLSIFTYEDLLPFDQFLLKLDDKKIRIKEESLAEEQALVQPIYLNPPQITPSKKCFT